MSSSVFDTHAFVKNLTEAGMPEKQAEALAYEQLQLLANHLASKADLVRMDDENRHRLEKMQAETDAKLTLIREEMRSMEARLVSRLGAIVAITGAALAAFLKLA